MKTLEELNQKPWYRFLKVIYVVMWLPYPLILYALSTLDSAVKACMIMTVIYVLFLKGLEGLFILSFSGSSFRKQR